MVHTCMDHTTLFLFVEGDQNAKTTMDVCARHVKYVPCRAAAEARAGKGGLKRDDRLQCQR
ncbi:hypothetical protein KSB_57220 [Ktedonobacter robiniae]|uniref:Uncharacterized protein n=1 Tax=Ktedonobacter robiniae TaxID=2778365 RepID=A0ABQ3UX57_9CHLR|nr:hypothetical protein KSB_57220 [Ktedonobacter robiniae]